MKQNKLTKVIQFVDEGTKRRIVKGYYGSDSDWNPKKEISLCTLQELPALQDNGIRFEQSPSISEGEYTTFIEIEEGRYACIENYAPLFMANKQQVLALVLQKLGIHEYFIKSEFQISGGVGHKRDIEEYVEKECLEANSSHDVGVDVSLYKIGAEYNRCKGRTPNINEWHEAKELAIKSGIYQDIADIIEMRKPGSNEFQCKLVHKRMGGQIDANISLASSLKFLSCLSKKLVRSLEVNASLKGFYDTLIFYNFNPEVDSVEYKRFIDKEMQNV